ncbi:signal recognition particle protein [Coccomyxa subellipsoidea C-169]|uniref:signal-recognition-particle GTPase n=1 Tax=Coccomyxa subellipsoidea (strain C-169) TaxID=574566 RepID=I0YJE8_COCSC|nr:signal recognition particle protein [Coccomyxa subellipsoidea C-169]EIE18517.1 signal recognition particle protein [Coccomyxa subellipsoidea C-169]|eukprot:XP_005643061.1 signal recognition particle protein [Coccomyxa subellipsoidea C-169]
MFDNLSQRLEGVWDTVRKDGKLTADNIKTPMREIRRALLEADVSLPVVRQFVKSVEETALGTKVLKGVRPDQQLVKVVNDQLVELMGGQQQDLNDPKDGPQVILMAGLQGVGKTTACGKLALALQKRNKRVLMVATDVYRPAAIDQLVSLGERINVPVFEMGTDAKPAEIARRGLAKARAEDFDAIIVDTAGRLQIDANMMSELREVQATVQPSDTLLVVDAMTGQEAAGLVKAFNEAAEITGAILTKMDGDSRGGAALSVKAVSGKPIKFVGTGEKLEALEPFYPDRIASRILGMGDVLTLVEKAEASIKEEDAAEITKRMLSAKFDFNDFLKQYKMVSGMGSMGQIMKMLPGMNQITEKQLNEAEKQFKMFEALINSMTPEERTNPDLLAKTASRRRRIARGAGRIEVDVTNMIGTFGGMRAKMQSLSKMMKMGGGAPGMPQLSDQELLEQTIQSAGSSVSRGKVRRKKEGVRRGGRGGLAELTRLR